MKNRIHDYLGQRDKKEGELRRNLGGVETFPVFAKEHPYALVKLAWECLSRVQHLPAFPNPRSRKSKDDSNEEFVRGYVARTLALAEEVARAGRSVDSIKVLMEVLELTEWLGRVGRPSIDSALFGGAENLIQTLKWLCGGNIYGFTNFILKPISSAIVLGLVESTEFSEGLENFVVDEVAKIRAERAGEPDSFEGAKMPQVVDTQQTERALALLEQLSGLIESNPAIVKDLLPRLSELTQLIEQHRPANTARTLNTRQASERAGCSHVQLLRLLEQGELGERDAEGRPRFSEQECDAYRETKRPPGRPKKSAERS